MPCMGQSGFAGQIAEIYENGDYRYTSLAIHCPIKGNNEAPLYCWIFETKCL